MSIPLTVELAEDAHQRLQEIAQHQETTPEALAAHWLTRLTRDGEEDPFLKWPDPADPDAVEVAAWHESFASRSDLDDLM